MGKRIKELRNKHRLTQTELATQVGVTKSTIAAYENDSRQPSYEVLIKIAQVFKVSIDSILLNRAESILDINGLTIEQTDILNSLIIHFKKCNYIEERFTELSPELQELLLNQNTTNETT